MASSTTRVWPPTAAWPSRPIPSGTAIRFMRVGALATSELAPSPAPPLPFAAAATPFGSLSLSGSIVRSV
eukprot:44019-Prymnesium_polylepis.2